MKSFVASLAVALVVSALLVPLVRRLALRWGVVSYPGGRHVHTEAIPRLGGLAIFFAFFAPLPLLIVFSHGVTEAVRGEWRKMVGLAIGGTIMCVVGAVDDARGLRALHKLILQIGAATIAFAYGFRIEAVSLPLIGEMSMGIFALPITVVWIVGVINAINLIDGLDGLAAGVAIFASITNFVVAYIGGSTLTALLMASLFGAAVGFLIYNFNPARIFMGDSGSYFIGFVLATAALAGSHQKASTTVALLVPIVALGVPIFDTLFAMVRRFLERRPIFSPDRGHIHHRLLDMGLTHRRAVLIIYGVSIVLTLSAVAISLGRSWQVGVAIATSSIVLIGLVRFVGYFDYVHLLRRQRARFRTRHAEMLRHLLPDVPAALARANTEEDLVACLDEIASRAKLGYIELYDNATNTRVSRVTCSAEGDPGARELVSAEFPLGEDSRARASITFGWRSDFGDVSPQTDMLLQVITDIVAHRLTQIGSPLAPRAVEDQAESSALEGAVGHTDRGAVQL